MMRTETRRERYNSKNAVNLPIDAACVNFGSEANLLHASRAALCFGAEKVHLIGNCSLSRDVQRSVSGTTIDFIDVVNHKGPIEFLDYCLENEYKIIALELPQDYILDGKAAYKLSEYEFDFKIYNKTIILSGHETFGVPIEILKSCLTDIVYIDMIGKGYCLNTSQALNIALYEASKQYMK